MKQTLNSIPDHLPLRQDLKPVLTLSLITTFLMTAASLGGLLFPYFIYPSAKLRETFLANDLVNLLAGLPFLLVSIWLTRRGKLVGLLSWPGALLYVTYNYLAYLFGIPFGLLTIVFFALVLLSAYAILVLLRSIDAQRVHAQLNGIVPVRITGWVLILFGAAFLFRSIGMLAQASSNQIPPSEIGVLIADLMVSALWILGGILLLRRKPLGYASGLGLLLAASVLYIALIIFLLLQPFLTGAPFSLVDVLIVAVMGLVCFIPTGLFIRGVNNSPVTE